LSFKSFGKSTTLWHHWYKTVYSFYFWLLNDEALERISCTTRVMECWWSVNYKVSG